MSKYTTALLIVGAFASLPVPPVAGQAPEPTYTLTAVDIPHMLVTMRIGKEVF